MTKSRVKHTGAMVLLAGGMLVLLALIVEARYQHAIEHPAVNADAIVAGESLAPVQYRILAPALIVLLDRTLLHDHRLAQRAVVFGSVLTCLVICGFVFHASSRSVALALLALICYTGILVAAVEHAHRTEFFEIACVAGTLHAIYHVRGRMLRAVVLVACTLIGSLNSEKHVFALLGMSMFVFLPGPTAAHDPDRRWVRGLTLLCWLLWVGIMIGVRIHFGWKSYYCDVWMLERNLSGFLSLRIPLREWHFVLALMLAYVVSLIRGAGSYGRFIAGYAIPFFTVALFIALLAEVRILTPLAFLLISSLVGGGRRGDVTSFPT